MKLDETSSIAGQQSNQSPAAAQQAPSESAAGSTRWRVYVVSRVLEVATVVLILIGRTAPLVVVGLPVSAITLALEVVLLRWRRRLGPVSGGAVVVQIAVGVLGLGWFCAVIVLAVINVLQHDGQ